MSVYMILTAVYVIIMLKQKLTRYNNFVLNVNQTISITNCRKKTNKLRVFYKKLFINIFYLKRHSIQYFKNYPNANSSYFFMAQVNVIIRGNEKKKNRLDFFWINNPLLPKTQYSAERHTEFYCLLLRVFYLLNFKNFCHYWLSAFVAPMTKTRFYCYTNNIKFFINQRLVKKPILILYSTVSKNNMYSNYLKVFKGLVARKKLNTLYFAKSIILQMYPKLNTTSYFFRHNHFLKKFVTQKYLKLVLT